MVHRYPSTLLAVLLGQGSWAAVRCLAVRVGEVAQASPAPAAAEGEPDSLSGVATG